MAMRQFSRCYVGLMLLMPMYLFAGDAEAAMYKCSDGQGGVSYSQLPCEQGQESTKMSRKKKPSSLGKVCAEANRFAIKVVNRMRRGSPAGQVIGQYGGLDLISKGALGIINYVYSYRLSDSVSAQKIAALTVVKCKGGNFGEVSYADIPGAIDPDSEEGLQRHMLEVEQGQSYGLPASAYESSQNPPLLPKKTRSSERKAQKKKVSPSSQDVTCKNYRKKLDALDDKMRSGYSVSESNGLREKRRRYRESIKQWCK